MSGKTLAPFKSPKMAPRAPAKGRTVLDERAAQAFIQDESRRRRAVPGERLALYLPKELAHELRVAAVTDRRSLSDAVTDAVREWLLRRAKR